MHLEYDIVGAPTFFHFCRGGSRNEKFAPADKRARPPSRNNARSATDLNAAATRGDSRIRDPTVVGRDNNALRGGHFCGTRTGEETFPISNVLFRLPQLARGMSDEESALNPRNKNARVRASRRTVSPDRFADREIALRQGPHGDRGGERRRGSGGGFAKLAK